MSLLVERPTSPQFVVVVILFLVIFPTILIFNGARIFTFTLRTAMAGHGAHNSVLSGRGTAISAIPATVLIIVIRITPLVSNELPLTTTNAMQKRRIRAPVKLLCAREGHAPLVFVAL